MYLFILILSLIIAGIIQVLKLLPEEHKISIWFKNYGLWIQIPSILVAASLNIYKLFFPDKQPIQRNIYNVYKSTDTIHDTVKSKEKLKKHLEIIPKVILYPGQPTKSSLVRTNDSTANVYFTMSCINQGIVDSAFLVIKYVNKKKSNYYLHPDRIVKSDQYLNNNYGFGFELIGSNMRKTDSVYMRISLHYFYDNKVSDKLFYYFVNNDEMVNPPLPLNATLKKVFDAKYPLKAPIHL